jgi:hypothetical protein
MAGSTGGNLSKNNNSMKKINFKQKKYVMPLWHCRFCCYLSM